ncbi:glycosyltransferase family 4 protein [Stenomitos frigidus]|uniref:Mannosyltransferase n=1 Tax=Stenomitos frigidus ULC18 TaxID=2107698 RepID=A0A2T1EPK7_9CYAN|nr:glycosyltransferase family 1 protein [Stenomitos frigidus]PSB34651.1 mannosyltransferase [Stenomitos frigidus ULC18]
MTILVNLSPVLPQPTGISTYSLNIVKELRSLKPDVVSSFEIDGYTWHRSPADLTAEYGLQGHFKRLLWTQFQLPKFYQKLNSQLLFSVLPEAPLWSSCRSIVMVHDLIPLHFPKRFSPATFYNRHYIPQVLKQAEHIICNSNATAQDIVRFCDISANQITSIPLAYDAQNFQFLDLPTQNYFLYLGRVAPYKNVQRAIAAFATLPHHSDYEFWLAGPPDQRQRPLLQAQIEDLKLTNQVKFLDYVAYEDLPRLMNQAIGLIFPSLWEGFGLPALEAMACGTPVITSNLSSLPEVTGEAALLVDPYNVGAIAQAMHELVTDSQLRAHLRTASLARASQFSWAKTGQATADVLQRFS